MITISAIIPTFNRPDSVVEAINSVINQSHKVTEIIVVDNSDIPLVLPKNLEKQVRLIRLPKRAGAAQARNFGAVVASGEYLAFLDDDDLWPTSYIERAYREISKSQIDYLVSRIDIEKDGKRTNLSSPTENDLNKSLLFTYNPGFGGSNIILRRDIFFSIGGFTPRLTTSEDRALCIELIKVGAKIKTIEDNYIILRDHEDESLTRNYSSAYRGFLLFTIYYGREMSLRQILRNLCRVAYVICKLIQSKLKYRTNQKSGIR